MAPKARVQKRLYYKIGEACKALGIQPYVLRYWETEFPALSPSKSRSGQRVYSEKELEVIRRIKQLLYDEGYTIAGAKKKLEGELAAGVLGEPGGAGGPGSLATPGALVVPPVAAAAPVAPVAPAVQAAPAAARAPADLPASSAVPAVDGVRGVDAAYGFGSGSGRGGGKSVGDGGAVGGGAAGTPRAVPLPLVPVAPVVMAVTASGVPETGHVPGLVPASSANVAGAAGESTTGLAVPAAPPAPKAGAPAETSEDTDPIPAAMSAVPGPFGLAAVPVPEVREVGVATAEAMESNVAAATEPPRDLHESRPTLPLVPPMSAGGAPPVPAPVAEGARAGSRRVGPTRAPGVANAVEAADQGGGPAVPAEPAPALASSGSALDTDAVKQIETVRKGIHRALENAREILALLDSSSPQ
ncbi:MAG TPA: MerR family transcriptional regulator [Thermoanaerobaculia bacterium]|nr:MerR family transcriptional regulator [Thermoanaerobaculia bacterium]